jgi:hypothetical protein
MEKEMNLKNLFTKLSLLVLFVVAFSANTFAATWYVSFTNGRDDIFPGNTQAQPYQTITKALSSAADGDVIDIYTDTYLEGGSQLAITKAVTLQVLQTPSTSGTQVILPNGININSTTGTKTVTFVTTGFSFTLGANTPANALLLTAGTLNNSAGAIAITSGGTITRNAGSVTAAFTTTNVNVTYNSAVDVAAGPELPTNLGTGTLTINITAAGKTLSVASNVQISTGNILTAATNLGNATFSGVVTVSGFAGGSTPIQLNTPGTLTFTNPVVFTSPGPASLPTQFGNLVGGTISVAGGITPTNALVGMTNIATGKIQIGAGNYAGAISNNGGGTIELLASATFSNSAVSNAGSSIKLNSNQLTLSSATGTLVNAGGFIYSTNKTPLTAANTGTGLLLISGVFLGVQGELPNLTITGKVTLAGNTNVFGNFVLNSSAVPAFVDGGNTLNVSGNFTRQDNTVGNFSATGLLQFTGSTTQLWNPGSSLTVNNVNIANTGSASDNIVDMQASVAVAGSNFTITTGKVDLSDYNNYAYCWCYFHKC